MIYLYSTPSCSKCKVLKMQLEKENIEFKVIEDIQAIQEAMYKAKIMSIPFAEINGKYITDATLQKIKEEL